MVSYSPDAVSVTQTTASATEGNSTHLSQTRKINHWLLPTFIYQVSRERSETVAGMGAE